VSGVLGSVSVLQRVEGWPLGGLWVFGIKQAWAALFGGALLAAIALTHWLGPAGPARFDVLFLVAVAVQLVMVATRLEKPHELVTIMSFHLVGLGMELFKTADGINSWSYGDPGFFSIGHVPLFSGFMYAAVGSYIARAWRVMDFRFERYPNRAATVLLAVTIYVNFFTHHWFWDLRWLIFAVWVLLFGRSWIGFRLQTRRRRLPLLIATGLVGTVIWLAENVATFLGVWSYPNQLDGWQPVGIEKLGSWTLLIVLSGILVEVTEHVRNSRRARGPVVGKLSPSKTSTAEICPF